MTRVVRIVSYEARDRWSPKKPVRIWASFNPKTGRLRSFASREASEACGGVLMYLWMDGCIGRWKGRTVHGWLSCWYKARDRQKPYPARKRSRRS